LNCSVKFIDLEEVFLNLEIERKFLVNNSVPLPLVGKKITQGYFPQSLLCIDKNYGELLLTIDSTTNLKISIPADDIARLSNIFHSKLYVECRLRLYGGLGFVTIKSKHSFAQRDEFEYEVSYDIVKEVINKICFKVIEKTRYLVDYNDALKWEIDVFNSANKPLITVEIEVPYLGYELIIPKWIIKEITGDKSYSNFEMATLR